MDLPFTLAACALFLVLAVVCGWLGARPINVLKGPRMVPWRFLMLLLVVVLAV